jgi:hypothetical protein
MFKMTSGKSLGQEGRLPFLAKGSPGHLRACMMFEGVRRTWANHLQQQSEPAGLADWPRPGGIRMRAKPQVITQSQLRLIDGLNSGRDQEL